MSVTFDRNTATRLQREIADLRGKEAVEIRKQADLSQKMHTAAERASRSSSSSTAQMYLREAQRHSAEIGRSQARHSSASDQVARKTKELARIQERISRAEAAEAKSREQSDRRQKQEHARKMRELEERITAIGEGVAHLARPPIAPGATEARDVFICHAHEDKADFVDELAAKAEAAGLKVWYDDFELEWGGSLRQGIDRGLAGSYLGVVVFSPHFFAKPWAQYELDGLVEKDLSGQGRVLPVWHRVTQDEVRKASPPLAGRLALNTMTHSVAEIVERLVTMRDKLLPINGEADSKN